MKKTSLPVAISSLSVWMYALVPCVMTHDTYSRIKKPVLTNQACCRIIGIVIFEAVVLLLPVWSFIKNLFQDSVNKTIDRVLSVLFTATFSGILAAYLIYFGNGAFDGLKDIVLLTFANYCIFVIIVQCLLYILPGQQVRSDYL